MRVMEKRSAKEEIESGMEDRVESSHSDASCERACCAIDCIKGGMIASCQRKTR